MTFLDFATRWRWVVSFTPRPLYYTGGKRPRYPLDRRLGRPQSGMDAEEKRYMSYPGRNAFYCTFLFLRRKSGLSLTAGARAQR
jgi:hypothetical protein